MIKSYKYCEAMRMIINRNKPTLDSSSFKYIVYFLNLNSFIAVLGTCTISSPRFVTTLLP